MGFKVNEIVITPAGRGVIVDSNADIAITRLDDEKIIEYSIADIQYEILPDYEEKKFFIAHATGALQITAQPIRYMDNGVAKIKFEIKSAFNTCKIFRNEEGDWLVDEGEILPKYLILVANNLRRKYNT
jgi:hypothetical protein